MRVPTHATRLSSLAALMLLACVLAGCASSGSDAPVAVDHPGRDRNSRTQPMAKMSMEGMQHMEGMHRRTGEGRDPSQPARMICSSEIREAVMRTFALPTQPGSTRHWSGGIFGCTYQLPMGELRLSVNDAVDPANGGTYYRQLRARLPSASTIQGMQNLGLPAFQTPYDVVFLKDGKTLRVDARAVTDQDLPARFTRQDVAYGVASAVVACWTE